MSDALAWLRAQLDDDERVAKAVFRSRLRADGRKAKSVEPPGFPDLTVAEAVDDHQATYIARWDPARALAVVTALCQALDEFHHEAREYEVIILLARALYADRPGFPEEWR